MKTRTSLCLLILLCFVYSVSAQIDDSTSLIYLKSNLEFLASDELEGREATTRGEKIASLFLAKELKKYGVKPLGDDGTYFQNFKLKVSQVDLNSEIFLLSDGEKIKSLRLKEDLIISKRSTLFSEQISCKSELVFLSYGIDAANFGFSNYTEIDVKGKFVVVLPGTPKFDEDTSVNLAGISLQASNKYKVDAAKNNGAVGIIFVPGELELSYWDRYKKYSTVKSFSYYDEKNKASEEHEDFPVFYISKSNLDILFNDEKYEYDLIESAIDSGEDLEVFNFEKIIEYNIGFETGYKNVRNVVGVIEGNDTKLKKEYVSMGAHYDHEGVKSGKVYNGADDNGSGTVTILDAARVLSLQKENKRSLLFVFHTAEEKGLIGAKHFVNNFDYIDDVVVNMNIDMVGRKAADSIYCIGSDKLSTELHEIVQKTNKETSNFYLDYSFNDPLDPQRLYYRSDHVHYANKGIPIVFFYDYMKVDYHKPSDTVDKINFAKILKVRKLVDELALTISNLDHRLIVDKLEAAINK